MRKQDKQFLVEGALLECPYGTKHCRLLGQPDDAALKIGNKTFLGINTTKVKENIEGFGQCTKEGEACEDVIILEEYWRNPVSGNGTLTVQGENEAIHRKGRLLCLYGKKEIYAITTGQKELTESEKKFIRYMQENFGFDEEVILIMLKVIHAIDETYPDETERKKAWIFARLMGGFTYGNGETDRLIEIRSKEMLEETGQEADPGIDWQDNRNKQIVNMAKWMFTAGASPYDVQREFLEKDREEREYLYFTQKLGISEDEYYQLRFHVMAQHEITSRPLHTFPDYMIAKAAPNNDNRDAWIKLYNPEYDKSGESINEDIESCFDVEWSRLYHNFIHIASDELERLKNDEELFLEYDEIEGKNAEKESPYSPIPQYADFSHQQILTATFLVEDGSVELDTATGIIHNIINPVETHAQNVGIGLIREGRTSLAGWQGDLRLADGKMSIDDYRADLDAVNISGYIMDEELGVIESINEYYDGLQRDEITREKQFLQNVGAGNEIMGALRIVVQDQLLAPILDFKEKAGLKVDEFTGNMDVMAFYLKLLVDGIL